MEDYISRDPLIERRIEQHRLNLWESLTLAQKFSASSLLKYGYELSFIRQSSTESVAVMLLDGKVSTITADGEIDTTPAITIR